MKRTLPILLAFTAVVALAQLPTRRIGLIWQGDSPSVSFHVRDLGQRRSTREHLYSGLRQDLRVTVQAYAGRDSTPFYTRTATCSVTYDVFAERFRIRRAGRELTRTRYDEVVTECLDFSRESLGTPDLWRSKQRVPLWLAVRAELNPLAPERCRQLLQSNRQASDDLMGPIVINIVRRELCEADEAVDFQSPRFRFGESLP